MAVKQYRFLSGKHNTELTKLKVSSRKHNIELTKLIVSSYFSVLRMILCQAERRAQFNIPQVLLAMGKTIVQKTSIICDSPRFLLFCCPFFFQKIELFLCRRAEKVRNKLYRCVTSRQKCLLSLSIKTTEKNYTGNQFRSCSYLRI